VRCARKKSSPNRSTPFSAWEWEEGGPRPDDVHGQVGQTARVDRQSCVNFNTVNLPFNPTLQPGIRLVILISEWLI
jgi:hypothetical protein